jgi:hypothetical protein
MKRGRYRPQAPEFANVAGTGTSPLEMAAAAAPKKPSGLAEAATAVPAEAESVSVDRRAIYLPGGAAVKLRSPRLRRACKEAGVTVAELRGGPKDLDPKVLGEGVPPAVEALLRGAAQAVWEERIELVLRVRQRGIDAAARAKRAAGGAGGGVFGGGGGGGDDAGGEDKPAAPRQPAEQNPMVAEAEEHMERVLRRQRSETERSVRGLQDAWALRVAEEADEEAAQQAAEARHAVARERSEARAQRARVQQSESMVRFSRSHQSVARARRRKQADRGVAQETSAARVRDHANEARAVLLQRQARAENKRRQIRARNHDEQERQIEEGLAARTEYNAAVSAAQVASEERVHEQNARASAREARLEQRMQTFFQMEEAAADELAAQCRAEDERRRVLADERRRHRAGALAAGVAATDAKSERARKRVAAAVNERRHAVGASKSSIELKEEACAAAAARREELQGMQAAKALVKRVRSVEHVTRMRRLEDYRREQNLKAFEERQRRANATIEAQRRLREEQRSQSRDVLIDRASRLGELDRSLRKRHVRKPRPATAGARMKSSHGTRSSSGGDMPADEPAAAASPLP